METTTSAVIEKRLRFEAQAYAQPERRVATVDRLIAACDAIARGDLARSDNCEIDDPDKLRITAKNIADYANLQGWSGPTRTFLSGKKNGLIEYINAREHEREKRGVEKKTRPKTQLESLLGKIEDIETRQYVRYEIERRKQLEQELNLIKNGLKRVPQIDLQTLLSVAGKPGTQRTSFRAGMDTVDFTMEQFSSIRSLLDRFDDTDTLRHLGLKIDAGDILSFSNALVVAKSELDTLRSIVGGLKK